MFPRIWSEARTQRPALRGMRRLVIAVMLMLSGVVAIDGGSRSAEAQTPPRLERSAPADDISTARRGGGRKAWLRHVGRARAAHRSRMRERGDAAHQQRGPGDTGDHRPRRPEDAPEKKPDVRDHARNDGRDDKKPSRADNPPGSRDPEARPPDGILKPEPASDPVVCVGGRVLDGGCRCDGARVRLSREQRMFSCLPIPAVATLSGLPHGSLRFDPRTPRDGPPDRVLPTPPNRRTGNPDALDPFVPDEVLVTVARTMPDSIDNAVGQSHGLELVERRALGLIDRRIVRYRIADGRPVAAVVAALRADPRVFDPQPNYYYRPRQAGSPPGRAAGLQYALSKLEALRAHTLARGRGTLVAVIDTGVDHTHPDLAGRIAERFDAVERNGNADPHGTAIAGIIAANGILRGVAPEARLLDVRAFAPAGPEGPPAATTLNLLRGMEWAEARRARVLNMSFTGPKDALLERGIAAASARGAIIVAAAGNGGAKAPSAYPAAYPQVIAVTAIDVADRRYREANQGRYIAVAAPGVDILTASADHAHRLQSGTSFAAAHVSGILALMLERDPALTADAARHALMTTAHDLGPPGPDDQFGVGRPDAFAALGALRRE